MASDDELAAVATVKGHGEEDKKKKRKRKHKKTQKKKKKKGANGVAASARPTVSIALPGSIIDNAQSPELQAYLAGQIARAMTIFCIDEVVVFSDVTNRDEVVQRKVDADVFLCHILQYLECPQYLRKHFFPKHRNLKFAGLLNPTDSPHHMRANEWCRFREGVVVDRPVTDNLGSYVNIGLNKEGRIDRVLQPGLRVTVEVDGSEEEAKANKKSVVTGRPVPPSKPVDSGVYWGYRTRLAKSLSDVWSQCPYAGGYDLSIGTSDKGENVYEPSVTLPPTAKHILIVFGGLRGLEDVLEVDDAITVTDPRHLFDVYLNTCPHQGSRTIRTEEAILISLAAMQGKLPRFSGVAQ